MAKVLTHNYMSKYDALRSDDLDYFDIVDTLLTEFEQEVAEHLKGLTREDVGAVMLYLDSDGEEQAWFDYENFVGSVRALGGTSSDQV